MRLPISFPRCLLTAACLCLLVMPPGTIHAQLTGQNKPVGGSDVTTISVTTRLVVETVVAKDKSGKPIDGLTAKDFTITEDGVAQKIAFCEHQTLPDVAAPMTTPTSGPENIKIYNRLSRTQISSETPGE